VSDRRCRQCDACCEVVAVAEIAKPEQARCPHQGQDGKPGCAIYEERPESCRTWSCGWLRGYGKEKDRPDKLGVIFDAVETVGGPTIQVREVWMGSFQQPRAMISINGFAKKMPVVLMFRNGTRKLIGPQSIVRKMLAAAEDGTAEKGGGFVPNCDHGMIRSQCRPCMESDIQGGAQ
jgi:hypothetical protein